MTTDSFNPLRPDSVEPTREDVLIGRVVDGEATTADWDALETIARADGTVWERLGRAQRAHARLEREVEDAIAIAELIDVPSPHSLAVHTFQSRFRQWGGWAAAAVIGLAWIGAAGFTGSPKPGNVAGLAGPTVQEMTPDALLDQYIRRGLATGRVVGEMPAMLVNTQDLGGGQGKEVWFVRPILERTNVSDVSLLSVQMDEHGMPRYVPMTLPGGTGTQPNRPTAPDPL